MEIVAATLAAYVEMASDGRVTIASGDLDTLRVPDVFPATTNLPLYFYVKFRYPVAECGLTHEYRMEIVGPNGEQVMQGEHQNNVPPSANGRPVTVGNIIVLAFLTFPAAGEYEVRVFHDGVQIRTLPLYVEPIPAAAEG
jgi:hypothetical protein